MKTINLKPKRYKQLLRKEKALVEKVKPLVEKLHRITSQHNLNDKRKQGFYGKNIE